MGYRYAIRSSLAVCLLLNAVPGMANDFNRLKGGWRCQEDGVQNSLDFKTPNQLIYNGVPAQYQLLPNAFRVQEEYGPTDYYYEFRQQYLLILSPDGSISYCQKAPAAPPRQAGTPKSTPNNMSRSDRWPPPYRRPSGTVSWTSSDAGALLYKFAGRWDSVTSNTLHNIYLKPDGSYEEAYEAGYSGQFTDQGGYQTGNWGAAGQQQWRGQWRVTGSLQKGTLSLIDQNGKRTDYHYQVHIERGEYYGGEYFFNGKLYSVKYIYR